MKAVTAVMVVVWLGIAGTCIYVAVSGYFLATKIVNEVQSISSNSGGGGGGSNSTMPNMGPLNVTMTNTTLKVWLPLKLNNTGAAGLDIKDLTVKTTITTSNGTSFENSTDLGSIPFGSSKMVNITLIDTTPAKAQALANQTVDISLAISITVGFPGSWGMFALTISRLDFTITVPGVRFG